MRGKCLNWRRCLALGLSSMAMLQAQLGHAIALQLITLTLRPRRADMVAMLTIDVAILSGFDYAEH